MRIKLDDKIFFERNPKIKVTFEDNTNRMQNSLDNLEYRVVNSKDKTLFCKISGNVKDHNGALFLKKFTNSVFNFSELADDISTVEIPATV